MSASHTPTPYRAAPREEIEVSGQRVIVADGRGIAYVQRDEDAEFIVKAVNAHDDLVAALKAASKYARAEKSSMLGKAAAYSDRALEQAQESPHWKHVISTCALIDAALAKAGGV